MANLRHPDKRSYLRMLWYGQPGSGKTRTTYSAALVDELWPVLVLESGGNPESAFSYERLPYIVEIEQLKDLNDPYDWIDKGCPSAHRFAKQFELTEPVRTIIIDGITDVQRLSFAQVTGNRKLGPGDIGARVERQHFGSVLNQMTRMAKYYFSLKCHVLVTALEKHQNNSAGALIRIAPLIWGQSENEVSGYALVNARLVHNTNVSGSVKQYLKKTGQVVGSNDSVAFFEPEGLIQAKDQYGRLPSYMTAPTMRKVYDAVFSGDGAFVDPSA